MASITRRLQPSRLPRICPEVFSVPILTPLEKPAIDIPHIPLPLTIPEPSSGSIHTPKQITTPSISGCRLYTKGKASGRKEKWWLEYQPKKADYFGNYGRGPKKGNSLVKTMWDQQMININFKNKWHSRESIRYAFRKNGFEYDTPKWGG